MPSKPGSTVMLSKSSFLDRLRLIAAAISSASLVPGLAVITNVSVALSKASVMSAAYIRYSFCNPSGAPVNKPLGLTGLPTVAACICGTPASLATTTSADTASAVFITVRESPILAVRFNTLRERSPLNKPLPSVVPTNKASNFSIVWKATLSGLRPKIACIAATCSSRLSVTLCTTSTIRSPNITRSSTGKLLRKPAILLQASALPSHSIKPAVSPNN